MERICGNCKYFVLHYRKEPADCYPVYCGHCFRLRVKTRKPDKPVCEYYEEKEGEAYSRTF